MYKPKPPLRAIQEAHDPREEDGGRDPPPKPHEDHGDGKTKVSNVWRVESDVIQAKVPMVSEISEQQLADFRQRMTEDVWRDHDLCQFFLSQSVGILPLDVSFEQYKWIFWTANELNESSALRLNELAPDSGKGPLMKRLQPEFQYKWIRKDCDAAAKE